MITDGRRMALLAEAPEGVHPERPVGREAEEEAFEAFLAAPDEVLLSVEGPGGVGKSTLLRWWHVWLSERGARVGFIDGSEVRASPVAVQAALSRGAPDPTVIFLDGADGHRALQGWFRQRLLPTLPTGAKLVVSARVGFDAVEWGEARRRLALRNLSRSDSATLLSQLGVPAASQDGILGFARGHPLALRLAAKVLRHQADAPLELSRAIPVVRELMQRLVDHVESPLYRRALYAASLVETPTEPLIAAMLDVDDGFEAFEWLARREFAEPVAGGLRLHDLVRDVVAADLAWRDPDLREQLVERAQSYYIDAMDRAPGEQRVRYLFGFFRLNGRQRSALLRATSGSEPHYIDDVRQDERPEIIEAVRRHEGDASAKLLARWFGELPTAGVAFRDSTDRIRGFVFYLSLPRPGSAVAASDPAVTTFLQWLEDNRPLRAGETATMGRWCMSLDDYQAPSPVRGHLYMHAVHRMAWGTTLGTLCFGDAHGFQDRADATQELFCEFEVGGRRFGIVGHDWRRESRAQWFERLRRIVRREPGEQPAPPPDEPTVLSRDEFDRCVRRALKALGKQGAPEDNPLERSHLVRNTSLPGAATLDGRIRAMVDRLEGGAGTRMHGAVLRGTYLGEASKGLAVADALGLPYGSYRRALRQGINAACDVLWDWELSNP